MLDARARATPTWRERPFLAFRAVALVIALLVVLAPLAARANAATLRSRTPLSAAIVMATGSSTADRASLGVQARTAPPPLSERSERFGGDGWAKPSRGGATLLLSALLPSFQAL